MPVKGNLTQPETLKKFAHVSFRKFVHLVQIVVTQTVTFGLLEKNSWTHSVMCEQLNFKASLFELC